ncbi:MAG: FkbM family methyltransferase [Desulfobaccales bacterium]
MGKIGRLARILRHQGGREVLRVVMSRCLDRLNADNNSDPATNGEFALLRAYLQPGMMALDVGANLGVWTAQALAIQPSLRVYAFEPVSHLFQALEKRFAGDGRVVLTNAALSDQKGETEIFMDGYWAGSNSLFCRHIFAEVIKETVMLATGDAFVAEHNPGFIDFLKLDVEGAELKVLQGFRETFARRQIGLCQLEYGGCYIDAGVSLRDVFTFAGQMGYGVSKLLPRGLRLLEHYDHTQESFKYANYLLYRDANLLPRRL